MTPSLPSLDSDDRVCGGKTRGTDRQQGCIATTDVESGRQSHRRAGPAARERGRVVRGGRGRRRVGEPVRGQAEDHRVQKRQLVLDRRPGHPVEFLCDDRDDPLSSKNSSACDRVGERLGWADFEPRVDLEHELGVGRTDRAGRDGAEDGCRGVDGGAGAGEGEDGERAERGQVLVADRRRAEGRGQAGDVWGRGAARRWGGRGGEEGGREEEGGAGGGGWGWGEKGEDALVDFDEDVAEGVQDLEVV